MLLSHLRNVLALPQSTQQFKNKLRHIVKSITVVNMSSSAPSSSAPLVNGSAEPTTNGTNGSIAPAAAKEVNSGDLVRFLELVGNLKVSNNEWSPDRKV